MKGKNELCKRRAGVTASAKHYDTTQLIPHKRTCHNKDSFTGPACQLDASFTLTPITVCVSCPLQHFLLFKPQGELYLTAMKRLTVQAVSVPVGTLFSPLAFSFYPEGTDVRTVTFIVRSGPSQLQQHVTGGCSFS